jgi:hypothetical protein
VEPQERPRAQWFHHLSPDFDPHLSEPSNWRLVSIEIQDPKQPSSNALAILAQHIHLHPHLRKVYLINQTKDSAALHDLPNTLAAFQNITWLEFYDVMGITGSWWPSEHLVVFPKVDVMVWESKAIFPSGKLILPSLRHLWLRGGWFGNTPMDTVEPYAHQLQSLVLYAYGPASAWRTPIPWELLPELHELAINFHFDDSKLPDPHHPLERLYLTSKSAVLWSA